MSVAAPTRSTPNIILLMGVSGCGKSTIGAGLSRALGWPFRDADSFHPPANVAKMRRGLPLDDEDRRPWLDAIAGWIGARRDRGETGIVSCSALKRVYRDRLLAGCRDVGLVYLAGEFELIAERLQGREGHFMPAALLKSQFDALEAPAPDEHPLIVPVLHPPERVVERIVAGFGLRPAAL